MERPSIISSIIPFETSYPSIVPSLGLSIMSLICPSSCPSPLTSWYPTHIAAIPPAGPAIKPGGFAVIRKSFLNNNRMFPNGTDLLKGIYLFRSSKPYPDIIRPSIFFRPGLRIISTTTPRVFAGFCRYNRQSDMMNRFLFH